MRSLLLSVPTAIIKWTTSLDCSGNPDFLEGGSITLTKAKDLQTVILAAKTDDRGSVTFYFGRSHPSNVPIGIDNIVVKGSVDPQIVCQDVPCPLMDVEFRSCNAFPEGTKYVWKVDGKTVGNGSSYMFTPEEPGDYKASLSVEFPGCGAETSNMVNVKVGDCGADEQGNYYTAD